MSDQGRGNFRRTLYAGSEEDFDVVCDPCTFENKRIEAKGYCLNCKENLCVTCIQVHKKMSALRLHVIENDVWSSRRPRPNTGRRQPGPDSDPLADRCPKHPEEIIKLYCKTHSSLGCCVCASLDHKACKDVSYIRDVSSGIANSDEVKTVLAELGQVTALLRFSKSRAQHNKQKIAERYSKALDEIECFKEEIVNYLNKLVDELRSSASDLQDNAVKASDDQTATCEELLQETEKLISDLDTRSSMGLNNGLFVAVKRTQTMLPDLKRNADHISSNTSTPRFVFKRDEKLNGLTSSCNSLGQLVVTSEPRDVKYVYDINTQSEISLTNCLISGIAVLPDNRLVINDNKNKYISVISSEKGINETETIAMTSTPIDLAVFKDYNVAVTLKEQTFLQVLSLKPKLSKCDTIKLQRLNAGIVYTPDVFYLSPQSSEKEKTIHMCDTSGKLLQTIAANLVDPWYLTVTPDKDVIYVSDHDGNKLESIRMDGERIRTYTAKDLHEPRGVAVDEDGFVYVCSNKKHAVLQLPPAGLSCTKVVTKTQGMEYPNAIAYSDSRVYISSSSADPKTANCIKVFELF